MGLSEYHNCHELPLMATLCNLPAHLFLKQPLGLDMPSKCMTDTTLGCAKLILDGPGLRFLHLLKWRHANEFIFHAGAVQCNAECRHWRTLLTSVHELLFNGGTLAFSIHLNVEMQLAGYKPHVPEEEQCHGVALEDQGPVTWA